MGAAEGIFFDAWPQTNWGGMEALQSIAMFGKLNEDGFTSSSTAAPAGTGNGASATNIGGTGNSRNGNAGNSSKGNNSATGGGNSGSSGSGNGGTVSGGTRAK